jgi:transposase
LEPPVSEAPLPPARQLAWLLVQPTSVLDEGEAGVVSRIEQDDTARAVTDLACRFTALVRAAGKGKTVTDDQDAAAHLNTWITQARTCDASAIATFASGLGADLAAVRAALTEPWSSGQAEGQINRLTLIKRQCYGRAGLDLLKRRMILTA